MVYRWDDLRNNDLSVDWGSGVRANVRTTMTGNIVSENGRNTRRPRTMMGGAHQDEPASERRSLSSVFIVIATLVAVGIAALFSVALMKSPAPVMDDGSVSLDAHQGISTTHAALIVETRMPSIVSGVSPTLTPSEQPSVSPSIQPSGVVYKAPPAPLGSGQACIDMPGLYDNDEGEMVSCDWFNATGAWLGEYICQETDIGRACLLTCHEFNDCYMDTTSPTLEPTSIAPTPIRVTSITLNCTGDATLSQGVSHANLGSSSILKIDSSPRPSIASRIAGIGNTGAFHALLRFDITQHDNLRPIESAVLRIKAAKDCSAGGYIQKTTSPHWDENSVTWDTAPEGDGTDIGKLGAVKLGFWYSIDVTSALVESVHLGEIWKDTFSLRLFPVGVDECLYISKDSESGGPELHIEYIPD